MTEIVLSCGHKIKTDNFDNLVCEKCSKRNIILEEKQKSEEKKPEYLQILDDITAGMKNMNKSIKFQITQGEDGSINYKYTEPAQLFMKIFHSGKPYEYEIKNVKKQPIQELKNILESVKEKSPIGKEFRSRFGHSSLRFITDAFYYETNYDGKRFLLDDCTKNKQKIYATIATSIVCAIIGLIFGL